MYWHVFVYARVGFRVSCIAFVCVSARVCSVQSCWFRVSDFVIRTMHAHSPRVSVQPCGRMF
jgi:hypothetical protein